MRPCGDCVSSVFFFQAEDGIRDYKVTGVQTCALPISITLERSASRRSGVVSAVTEVSSNGAVFPIQVKRQNFAVVEGISRRLWTRWAVVVRRLITGASALTVRQEPRSSLDSTRMSPENSAASSCQ